MTNSGRSEHDGAYLLFILVLSAVGVVLVFLQTVVPLQPDTKIILEYVDTVICVLFLLDFLVTLIQSPSKMRYLVTWGWLDLLSSVPTVALFRVGRLARIARIVRVMRGIRSSRTLIAFILERRAQSTLLAAVLITILLLVLGSVAMLQFEHGQASNIRGAKDAFWWTVVTLTTGGFGDRYPVTTEGRIVAAVLMVAGVALIGILTGFVASWFLAPSKRRDAREIDLLRQEIADIKRLIETSSAK